MGNLKDEATKSQNIQQHELAAPEVNYLRLLNIALQYHTMGQRIMSGFLYYVATNRLGYKDGENLKFEFDFQKEDGILTVETLPADFDKEPPTPPQA